MPRTFFNRLFSQAPARRRNRQASINSNASVPAETLEQRQLLTSFNLVNGELQVDTGGADDAVTVERTTDWYSKVRVTVTQPSSYGYSLVRTHEEPAWRVRSLRIRTFGGDDRVSNRTNIPDRIEGGWGDDTITGGNGPSTVFGGGGHDTISGRIGNDYLDGGWGNDNVYGGEGDDTIKGSSGFDDLEGNQGNDVIHGGGADDEITGGSGNDELHGEGGNDLIGGDSGNDVLFGGTGNDDLFGGFGNDELFGGSGNDNLNGEADNDRLHGGTGNDDLDGGTGQDWLNGQAGQDELRGGSGLDVLVSVDDAAIDVLYGNSGRDAFWIDSGDQVRDFNRSGEERINSIGSFVNGADRTLDGDNIRDFSSSDDTHNFSANPLFATRGPSHNDVDQGATGDCYFLAATAAVAQRDTFRIKQRVVDFGDGTYGVAFTWRGGGSSYYRVDGELPVYSNGTPKFAGLGAEGSLWVAIIEKAWAHVRSGDRSMPDYHAIAGGYPDAVMRALGGSRVQRDNFTGGTRALYHIAQWTRAGKAVAVCTGGNTGNWVKNHCYIVESVDLNAGTITLLNPWDIDGGQTVLTAGELARALHRTSGVTHGWV